jgi:hypothetical protein
MLAFDFYQVPMMACICNVFSNIKTDIDPHQSLVVFFAAW